jgi:hypothetical protein
MYRDVVTPHNYAEVSVSRPSYNSGLKQSWRFRGTFSSYMPPNKIMSVIVGRGHYTYFPLNSLFVVELVTNALHLHLPMRLLRRIAASAAEIEGTFASLGWNVNEGMRLSLDTASLVA